ncbi:GAF domain-containing protein [Mariniflexile litorale]|uniref:GAF domain-containing protein n=1 Tax=Mariniflexile litorale TaxID=3045158 RepID=A0AAU7EBX1_9FLAO|nr:GAF domain-containing protein [Mariniflexile sp. KMM 9835]MDQ8210519.1 GAF domain-containing protein [Mariniflexile sp. KMM 9835]
MDLYEHLESPMIFKISFNELLKTYEQLSNSDDEFLAIKAKRILEIQKPYPDLREGFTDLSLLETYKKPIAAILQDSFSPILSNNEIKTASVPFQNIFFNTSNRFKELIKKAGDDFVLKIRNMPEDDTYIVTCTIILNFCYGYNLNLKRPFFYEIPDEKGILRYYKILYNADFCEIIPTEAAKKITPEDYDELLDNFDNIELWKEKFPPNSYIFKGFVISNIFDVTDDQSISNVKSSLISKDKRSDENFIEKFQGVFSSLLGIKDIRVGFSIYNKEDDTLEPVYGEGMSSFLLNNKEINPCESILCGWSYNQLLKEKKFYTISDVDKFYKLSQGKAPQIAVLKNQGIKSAILAPIADGDTLLGILEIVSPEAKVLNSINANKLIDVMPYIVSAVLRSKKEEENLIEAVIQQECTSIHPSVHWKFEKEAKAFINEQLKGNQAVFNKISFEDIYPLYGQIDIKGSSETRNWATQQDLSLQLNSVKTILDAAFKKEALPIYEQFIFQIDNYLENLKLHFQVDSEQQISEFLKHDINPLLAHLSKLKELNSSINSYKETIDAKAGTFYKHRKNYDNTIASINKKMASLLDKKQVEAQKMYPHYFERFKTDGVEHNMYIGESITKEDSFNPIYLYNLRLWQLQVMCEMENAYYQMQPNFSIGLDVASMILVFNQPLSISFRMDEKQFDVDGTYNARYEIVKKRVDKAFIKGTKQRVTQKGKMSIIYSQKQDELEYLRYIKFLQSKNYLDTDVEIVELQDLQAVTGLKAIQVSLLYHKNIEDKAFYTYNDLIKEIEN